MNLIVAVDENWGIGKEGDLLKRISADMKNFRRITTGNVLILGRKTLESFPNGTPLPNRTHIVLTNQKDYAAKEGVILCHTVADALKQADSFEDKEVFVIGGGSVYRQFLPLCDKAYVTKIKDTYPADTYLENLDENKDWCLAENGERQEENGIAFSFCVYTKQ